MKDVNSQRGEEGASEEEEEGEGGALYNLKGFHPVNWKDIIFWPGDALCEAVHYGVKTEKKRERRRGGRKRRKEKKNREKKKQRRIKKKSVNWGFNW